MKFISIKTLTTSIINTVTRFPFEVVFALIGTIAATINVKHHEFGSIYFYTCIRITMAASLGFLLSIAVTLYTESKGIIGLKKATAKILAAFTALSLYGLINPYIREFDTLRFFLLSFSLHLLVAFAAFTQKGQINGFWQLNKSFFLRFSTGTLYSIVLYLGLLAALSSTKYLFNADWDGDTYFILWIWIVGVFNTIFFLAGVPRDFNILNDGNDYPKGLKVFTQYVLIPLATVYVIILLAYETKILMEWRLPKGYVSNLILGYAVFGILSILLVYPIREQVENKWIKIYSRSFYFLLIPLIVLLFLAMTARVTAYGITPQRYLLIVLAVWLIFITAYFLLSKKQNIKLIPISLCILSLISIYGPQSAFSVSIYSQKQTLIDIFKKYDAYKGGKLQSLANKKISSKDGSLAVAKLSFLLYNEDLTVLQSCMDGNMKNVNDSLLKYNTTHAKRNTIVRYQLHDDKLEWAKKCLGLTKYNEYGEGYPSVALRKTTQFSAEKGVPLDVKNYEYLIRIINTNDDSSADTSTYTSNGVKFIKNIDNGIYSLRINNEVVAFDTKTFVKNLIYPQKKLDTYKETNKTLYNYDKSYILPYASQFMVKETSHYSVKLVIENISFYSEDDNIGIEQLGGYYLIKERK